MSRRKVWIICFVIAIPVCLGLYINYLLNNVVSGLFVPTPQLEDKVVDTDDNPENISKAEVGNTSASGENVSRETSTEKNKTAEPVVSNHDGRQESEPPEDEPQPASGKQITAGVEQQLDQPVDKKDLLKAGMLIIHKLSWDEISYLYEMGNKESRTVEEEKKIRETLLKKLTPEDVQVLRELGSKYGKKLDILDSNVVIK